MNEQPIFAFILMPFDPKFDDVYNIGIKEAAIRANITAERLDEQIFVEGMMERIYRQIEAADIIIADLSGKNPNVFYEVGYAHAKDKLCILLTNNANDIPFDLKHRRHIVYNDSILQLRDELTKNLEWAKGEIQNVRISQIRVSVKQPEGTLMTDEYQAKVSVVYRFDLFNDSKKPSSEIHAVYFYTGKLWSMKQGDKECAYTESDIEEFEYRYFLNSPVTRLQKNSWAQLHFSGTRVVAEKFKGDQIKNTYKLSGYSILRFVTSDGIFDYRVSLNSELSELPF